MFKQERWGFDWSEFITGVIFLIAAYFIIASPASALKSVVVLFALAAIIRGIATLAGFVKMRSFTGNLSFISLLAGIVDILVGIYFLMHLNVGVLTMSIIFAIWFIVDSIASLFVVSHLKKAGIPFMILAIILEVIGLIVGILMLMEPVTTAVTISFLMAFYFAVIGFNNIFISFARKF